MTSTFRRIAPVALIIAAGLATRVAADTQPSAGMLRFPDVSATHICFVYANDMWIVPRAGGVASPLASPPGPEQYPKFSPDGKSVAFVGNYDGGRDIYTMPVAGGTPGRVTHHPGGESLSDWSGDGKLLFMSAGLAGLGRQTQLFTVAPEGGMPSKLPVPYGGFAAISPDGTWLAYTPHSTDNRTWKRYRGGMATDIWLFNLKDRTSRKITDFEGTDTIPMWAPGGDQKTVYYLSDNGPEHRLNIWSVGIDGGNRRQITSFKDDDIRWPSMGPGADGKGEIVFQLGAKLMLLNLGNAQATEVKVTIPGAKPKLKDRTISVAQNVMSATISPTGKRVVVEARGELFSVPAKEGVTRNLSRSEGIAERGPSWSPDGRWIAYFSDASGEYELWVRPSDGKPPEDKKDDKKEDKKEDKKDDKKDGAKEAKPDDAAAATPPVEPKPQPRKLTDLGPGFRSDLTWSPDSKTLYFCDQNGRMYLTTLESGETREFDKDTWMGQPSVSFSSDSRYIAYSIADPKSSQGVICIYDTKEGKRHQVTSPMFASGSPAFDRKGDWLFFTSNRAISNPIYADLDTSFVYASTSQILMVPLRKDVKSPWLPTSDEETLKKDDKKAKKDDSKKDDAKKEEGKKEEGKKDEGKQDAAASQDPVTGTWDCTATPKIDGAPTISFTLKLALDPSGKVTGSATGPTGTYDLTGTFDKGSGKLDFAYTGPQGEVTMSGTIKDSELSGTFAVGPITGEISGKRAGAGGESDSKADSGSKDAPKEVKIDFDGLERRAMIVPVPPGNFGRLAVADGEKLVYSRFGARGAGGEGPSIKIYDYKSDEKEEKNVTAGAGGFELSADGKKLLVLRGNSGSVMDAAAGGGKATTPPTSGLSMTIDPRAEWKQIFSDAWRLQRDYFYEPTMHGVDWPKMREHYGAMIDDCNSREDVAYVIGELISELNIGHAYVQGVGDGESQPFGNVGMLGCDFSLETVDGKSAYRIAKIYQGGDFDADARGPLSQPGVDVKEGDFLLAIDGAPLDTAKDPWAGFAGLADRVVTLTVSSKPVMDGTEREVLVKPIGNEGGLRYRAWVERNRQIVAEKSGGRVGYIYVPDTGVGGQSELFRQFYGQRAMDALVIDDRWNGGGQIPSRFVELLNRPITNYWARRDGQDWPWPPDAHAGPKCMLINGLAGSGGDCFPWMFKQAGLGKLIGMRTWGGLVGISGNPAFVDGGGMSVPNFGFYNTDGTWGIEGHGVDPDMMVIDDPALMVDGGDPQLDAAINQMLEELKSKPHVPPQRPKSPNRSGMGITDADK